jgi:glycosyl hydrolase family 16
MHIGLRRVGAAALAVLALAPVAGAAGAAPPRVEVMFDDFSYTTRSQLAAHGWIVRTATGWPGIEGAVWSPGNVSFVRDPGRRGDRLLRLTSTTDGTAAGTSETQVCHERKYLAGTYATRVRFRDQPTSGPDGDTVVETFYTISPLKAPLDRDYGELDFEYLPNGGWDTHSPTLYMTTWETASLDPWIPVNSHRTEERSLEGWHTLVIQVSGGTVRFFVDGVFQARHAQPYYPKVPMSINYNLWFSGFGSVPSGEPRRYQEDVDWVFHQAGAVLSPNQVASRVTALRRESSAFVDTVPPEHPPLRSPCDF